MKRLFALVLSLALFCGAALPAAFAAEEKKLPEIVPEVTGTEAAIQGFEARYFTGTNGVTVRYRIREGSGKHQPLMIWMHGIGAVGTDNEKQVTANNGTAVLLAEYSPDWTVLAAQYEYNPDKGYTDTQWYDAYAELVQSLIQQGLVDGDRVYLGGGSLGGSTSWEFAYTHPELFAALLSCCAFNGSTAGDKINNIDRILEQNIPIRIFHAVSDEACSYDWSVRLYKYIQKKDPSYDVELVSYTKEEMDDAGVAVGHWAGWILPFRGEDGEQLLSWLWSQNRANQLPPLQRAIHKVEKAFQQMA